jgi:hypothetical protein
MEDKVQIKKYEEWKKNNPGVATCKGKGCLGHALMDNLCVLCYLRKMKEMK